MTPPLRKTVDLSALSALATEVATTVASVGGDIALVINTSFGEQSARDSLSIRRTALLQNVPYFTTIAGVAAQHVARYSPSAGTWSARYRCDALASPLRPTDARAAIADRWRAEGSGLPRPACASDAPADR